MKVTESVIHQVREFFCQFWRAYFTLLKILVPALLVVRLLEIWGAVEGLAELLTPVMSWVGLPAEMGLVWAAAMLTNIYTGLAVFYELSDGESLYNVAQVSTLGVMILVAHGLPVEGAVARALGVPWWATIALRVGGAFILGWIISKLYLLFDAGTETAGLVWQPATRGDDWGSWLWSQFELLIAIFLILGALMFCLLLLRSIGLERLLQGVMRPLMQLLSVRFEAARVTIIGLLVGLSFGAGLLIDEYRNGNLTRRDMRIVVCFLGLCHSVVEDTLLILLLGAELSSILWGRLIFTLLLFTLWRGWMAVYNRSDPAGA